MKNIHKIANALLFPISSAIPRVPNRCMAKILQFLTFLKTPERKRIKNLAANQKILAAAAAENDGFFSENRLIENQSEWENVRFGLSTMKYSGCEIMAVYNALLDLGNQMTAQTLAELIAEFEKNGAVLAGKWGCAPHSISQYFIRHGYRITATTSASPDVINAIGKNSSSVIITAYNDRNDIRKMIHTVSITKDSSGNYILHNVYRRTNGRYTAYQGNPPIQNLWDGIGAISAGQAAPICVIGIHATPSSRHN